MNLIDKLIKALLKDKRHISLQDRMVSAYLTGKKMPLKGHTRIIFTDTVTGKETVVADTTNLVTNAAASILANNIGGTADFSKMLPIKNLYAGVLCFQNEITEDADNYLPPNDITNPLIAHAGQVPNDTVSTLRGNPVLSDVVETDTSVKWVWEWDSSHGNGTIHTVCLCPEQLGDMGLKPIAGNIYNCWTPISVPNTVMSGSNYTRPYVNNRSSYLPYPISIDEHGKLGKVIYIKGTTFEEITVRHDWLSFGIMRGANDFQEVSSRTCTVRSKSKGQIFQDDDYYYYYAITGAHDVQIDRISKTDFTVTQMDKTSLDGEALYTGSFDLTDIYKAVPRFPYDGTYLYLPKSTGDGFVGVNPNSGVIKEITGTVTLYLSDGTAGNGKALCTPVVLGDSMIYGDSYIINGNNVYPHAVTTVIYASSSNSRRDASALIRRGAATYGYPACENNYESRGQGCIILSMFLSTINVLDEPVVKTNTVAMRIEYTISEA